MEVKVKFNEINVKEEKEQTLVKVLMLKGDKGDPGATDYNDLINKPTKLSDFTNDGVFITNDTEDLANYYKKSETYTQSETDNLLGNKVDKVSGKGLSTEDYTTTEKTKLSNIETEANKTTIVQSTGSSTTSVMSQNAVTNQLNNKVDKVSGKGLSTEDYTTTEKTKLSNIEAEANKTTVVQETGSNTSSVMSQKATTDELNNKPNFTDLALVAVSGNYLDLSNKPTIPSVNNYTAVLSSSSWSGASAPYTQTVNVSGILSTDTPTADVTLSSTTSTAISENEAWSCVSKIVTSNGSITATCLEEKPQTTITVKMQVVR